MTGHYSLEDSILTVYLLAQYYTLLVLLYTTHCTYSERQNKSILTLAGRDLGNTNSGLNSEKDRDSTGMEISKLSS